MPHALRSSRSALPAAPTPTSADQGIELARSLTRGGSRISGDAPRRGRLRRMHSNPNHWHDDTKRIELAAFQHEMYRGNQLPFLEPHPGESDQEFQRRVHLRTLNLTRVVIDVLSGLYRSPAERTLSGGAPAWREALEPAWRLGSPDALLSTADRLARLQGVCAVQPLWRDNRLSWRILPAHRLAVIEDPTDPINPAAVVTLSAGPVWDALGRHSGAAFADVWTRDEWMRVRGGEVVSRESHDYGRVPFAFLRDRWPTDSFWVEGRGHSLCYDNAVLNGRLSDLAEVIALQGFGVMEVVNPDPAQDIVLGPGRAVAFRPMQGEPMGINFKNPGAPIAELVEEMRESIRHILLSQRIPEHALSVSVSGGTSGIAIHAANSPVVEDRLERARLFAVAEDEMHRAAIAIVAAHTGLDPSDAPTMRVNFPEPDLMQTFSDKQRRDEWMLANGLTTPWHLLYRDNPDGYASLDEAKAVWLARRAELASVSGSPAANA